MSNLPKWFKFEPGFKFLDGDGDLCIYLGDGSFDRYWDSMTVSFPTNHGTEAKTGWLRQQVHGPCFALQRKDLRWFICPLFEEDRDADWFDSLEPYVPAEDPQNAALGVMIKDPKIRSFLEKEDPKALEQAEKAFKKYKGPREF